MEIFLDPSTFWGAVFASLVAGIVLGFFSGRKYQDMISARQSGSGNVMKINSRGDVNDV